MSRPLIVLINKIWKVSLVRGVEAGTIFAFRFYFILSN